MRFWSSRTFPFLVTDVTHERINCLFSSVKRASKLALTWEIAKLASPVKASFDAPILEHQLVNAESGGMPKKVWRYLCIA